MRRLRYRRTDDGIALPTVIGLGLVLMILATTGLSASISGLRSASADQDATGAYDAAMAGVQEYRTRIGADPSYGAYGNTASAFSIGSSLLAPPTTNYAFGTGAGGTWATVPDGIKTDALCPTGTTSTPCFRYEVDNRSLTALGVLRLRSTGRVGSTTRSLVVSFKRDGFYDFLYYTDFEMLDPVFSGADPDDCTKYIWQYAPGESRPDSCTTIKFGSSDVLDGPVHSNDTINTCATTFNQLVTTANPKSPYFSEGTVVDSRGRTRSCAASTFARSSNPSGRPTHVSLIQLPPTNTSMATQTYSDLSKNPGCLYTGPTVVKYLRNGKMTVWSPWTQFTNVTSDLKSGSNSDRCGYPGQDTNQLGSKDGATVDQLASNLLYVQMVPAAPSNVNYARTTSIPSGMKCFDQNGNNTATDAANSAGWSFGNFSFPMRGSKTEAAPDGWDDAAGLTSDNSDDASKWSPAKWSLTLPAYNCRAGDLYVSGWYTTQTTAASANYVYVTDDLRADKPAEDILGLVGQNAVVVWNPVNASKQALLSDTDREIDAAVLSVAHTFQVQNYNVSPLRGTLTVLGSIAQKYRGAVGVGVNGTIVKGYSKAYKYAPLLATTPPPYFLAPSGVNFAPQLYVNVPSAYTSSGAPR